MQTNELTKVEKAISISAKLKQPKALYLLFFVQMWESFSYYGMRAILVLYMVSELGLSDIEAFGIYAISTALSEGLGIFGGRLADKIFGLKYAIYLGGIIIAFGHIILSMPGNMLNLYLSLALIAVGTGLLRTNATALLGEFYHENDERRDAGYTLFYVGLNVGAFLATIGCAFVAETYSWHYGFSLAAFGMMFGLLGLFKFNYILENKGKKPGNISKSKVGLYSILTLLIAPLFAILIYTHEVSIYLVTVAIIAMLCSVLYSARKLSNKEKSNIKSVLIAVLLLALFFGFEEQIGSTLVLFADRFSDKMLFGFPIPIASLNTINPMVVLILGPLVALLLELYETKTKRDIGLYLKISLAFFLQALAFVVLYIVATPDKLVGAGVIGISFGIIAFSELFIGPAVYSHCSKYSPSHMKGALMGTVMLGFSLANVFSGFLSKYMAVDETNADLGINVYSEGFMKIMLVCFSVSCILLLVNIIRRRDNA
jgi:POT family proton-dependent oligopeptide transporter